MARARRVIPPPDVISMNSEITKALNTRSEDGRKVGDAKMGVYAFYDYDGEPIYVGQTVERMRTRIRRHLTNQRTDAVAMNVLDPFEVAELQMWPYFDLSPSTARETLDRAEYTVYCLAVEQSRFRAVLNEGGIRQTEKIELPAAVCVRIVPAELEAGRRHPDVRIARRASTIAALAHVIAERSVSAGLRRTLMVQAQRLEHLARTRFEEARDSTISGEPSGTGSG